MSIKDNINSSKKGLTYVGTVTGNKTLSCTAIPNYQSLTKDDFILCITNIGSVGEQSLSVNGGDLDAISTLFVGSTPQISNYDPSTGTLTVTGLTPYSTTWNINDGSEISRRYLSPSITAKVYVI